MLLLVKSIEHAGRILPIKLSAYDMDGQEGVYIPELENLSALKEMGANIGGTWERVLPSLLLPKTKSSRKRHAGDARGESALAKETAYH